MCVMTSKYPGTCRKCGESFPAGEKIEWERGSGASHAKCPEKKPAVKSPYSLHGGSGYGCSGWTVGQVVRVNPEKYDGNEFLFVLSASKRYWREDGLSFGVGDESGYTYSAGCRAATNEESAQLRDKIRIAGEIKAAKNRLSEIENHIRTTGTRPEAANPESEPGAVRMFDTGNIYGSGGWLVVSDTSIWYIRNNGMDGDNWSNNNVRTGGAGAIGWRIERDEKLVNELNEISKTIPVNP